MGIWQVCGTLAAPRQSLLRSALWGLSWIARSPGIAWLVFEQQLFQAHKPRRSPHHAMLGSSHAPPRDYKAEVNELLKKSNATEVEDKEIDISAAVQNALESVSAQERAARER